MKRNKNMDSVLLQPKSTSALFFWIRYHRLQFIQSIPHLLMLSIWFLQTNNFLCYLIEIANHEFKIFPSKMKFDK